MALIQKSECIAGAPSSGAPSSPIEHVHLPVSGDLFHPRSTASSSPHDATASRPASASTTIGDDPNSQRRPQQRGRQHPSAFTPTAVPHPGQRRPIQQSYHISPITRTSMTHHPTATIHQQRRSPITLDLARRRLPLPTATPPVRRQAITPDSWSSSKPPPVRLILHRAQRSSIGELLPPPSRSSSHLFPAIAISTHEPSDAQAHHPPAVASTSSTPTRQRPIQLTASAYSSSIQQRSGIPTPSTERSTEAATPPQNKKNPARLPRSITPTTITWASRPSVPHVTPQASHRTAPISSQHDPSQKGEASHCYTIIKMTPWQTKHDAWNMKIKKNMSMTLINGRGIRRDEASKHRDLGSKEGRQGRPGGGVE
ncbi:hypothetical protein ACLOJK_002609 [Asimina triloba]